MHSTLADLDCIVEYLAELRAGRQYAGIERRGEERVPLAVIVDFTPLDSLQRPCGEPRRGVTRDLSREGIGLFTESPLQGNFLKVRLPAGGGRRAELLVEVLRCERMDFMFDVGGRILALEWSGHQEVAELGTAPVPLEPRGFETADGL